MPRDVGVRPLPVGSRGHPAREPGAFYEGQAAAFMRPAVKYEDIRYMLRRIRLTLAVFFMSRLRLCFLISREPSMPGWAGRQSCSSCPRCLPRMRAW